MFNHTLLLRVHWEQEKVIDEMVNTLAKTIIPELKAMIERESLRITGLYGDDNIFARDAAAALLLNELIGFLAMDDFECPDELVQMHQLTTEHVNVMYGPSLSEKKDDHINT